MNQASDIAFSPSVKAAQERRGSRATQAARGFRSILTQDIRDFIAGIDTAYLATASAEGQPYAQHRGGPPGFIRVLDDRTLGFADYAGNRQYVTLGNLAENPRAFLFLMDYAQRRRVKLWGHARVVEDDPALVARLMPEGYRARAERAILFEVAAWDANCPQHIPPKLDVAEVEAVVGQMQARIAMLEAENARLRGGAAVTPPGP